MMREILKQNEIAAREAGRQLVEIGAELAGGKIDEALARPAAAQGKYAEWKELDQPQADIEGVIRDREEMLAVQHILVDLVGTGAGGGLADEVALMARISAKDRKLAQTLADPVLWDQAYLGNRDGSRRTYWPHQVEDLLCSDKNIIHLDGRDVGKSVCIGTDALYFAAAAARG